MDWKILAADTEKTAAALRSHLNQMAAASQVLEHTTQSEKGLSYLAVINQSICRMLRIVGRMELNHRLSEDHQVTLRPKYMNLAPWLDTLSQRLQGVLAEIGIRFTLHCPELLPACIDHELLQQMLLELVAGAALAGTDITLTAALKEQTVYFTLTDHGPGTAKGRPTLPDPVESQEEETSLTLARRIAELHGGSLMSSSNSDLGIVFAVSIPQGQLPEGQLDSPRVPWQSGGFDSVLVAMSQLLPPSAFLPENLN